MKRNDKIVFLFGKVFDAKAKAFFFLLCYMINDLTSIICSTQPFPFPPPPFLPRHLLLLLPPFVPLSLFPNLILLRLLFFPPSFFFLFLLIFFHFLFFLLYFFLFFIFSSSCSLFFHFFSFLRWEASEKCQLISSISS